MTGRAAARTRAATYDDRVDELCNRRRSHRVEFRTQPCGQFIEPGIALLGCDCARCKFRIELPFLVAIDVGGRDVLALDGQPCTRAQQRPHERGNGGRDEQQGDEPENWDGEHESENVRGSDVPGQAGWCGDRFE